MRIIWAILIGLVLRGFMLLVGIGIVIVLKAAELFNPNNFK